MRGTGSTDVELKDVFLPDAAMGGLKRTPGKWHPFIHLVCISALPIVYAAYLGVAESAREIALGMAKKKKDDPHAPYLVGEMDNFLTNAQIVHASMVELTRTAKPGPETTSAMITRRTIMVQALLGTVDRALEVAGGAGFYRNAHLERRFRDIQASRFHVVREKIAAPTLRPPRARTGHRRVERRALAYEFRRMTRCAGAAKRFTASGLSAHASCVVLHDVHDESNHNADFRRDPRFAAVDERHTPGNAVPTVRRRWQLLSEQCGREPGAHDHGERASGGVTSSHGCVDRPRREHRAAHRSRYSGGHKSGCSARSRSARYEATVRTRGVLCVSRCTPIQSVGVGGAGNVGTR